MGDVGFNDGVSMIRYFCVLEVDVAKQAFHSEDVGEDENGDEEREASPKAVGHNIFILAHQVHSDYSCPFTNPLINKSW